MKFSLNNILYFGLLASLLINPAIAKAAISTKNYHFLSGSVYYKYVYDKSNKIIGVEACSRGSDTKSDSGYSGDVTIPSEATERTIKQSLAEQMSSRSKLQWS